ncbi:MAG: response regulator [Polyangiaceae bacterium]|nr:response regulator [Polyangiaceae bacterium]
MQQRILVVDDEENQRRTLSIGLKHEGFEVLTASSAAEALAIFTDNPTIDVAVIDLMMPGINGLDLARQIGRLHPGVRVILASAYHLSARQFERANCGACAFVPKPYSLPELCRALSGKAQPIAATA